MGVSTAIAALIAKAHTKNTTDTGFIPMGSTAEREDGQG
jgi:hypothetical protein